MSVLKQKFIVPPFSIFDTKQGYWMDRKREWLSLNIEPEVARDDNLSIRTPLHGYISEEKVKVLKKEIQGRKSGLLGGSIANGEWQKKKFGEDFAGLGINSGGTSLFDPVLSEIIYEWFVPENGKILDPFAGGSVRGIVAEYLGYKYTGIELREEQVKANKDNMKTLKGIDKEILKNMNPNWICDDSMNMNKYVEDNSIDFVFSCPPYFDLEVYSELPNDISNMTYENFLNNYNEIIKLSCNKLKENRFACIVISNKRDKEGFYYNLTEDTINAFEKNDVHYYNEIILLNQLGSAPLRVNGQFPNFRKNVKVHQNILIFYKGEPDKIRENFGDKKIKNVFKKYQNEFF